MQSDLYVAELESKSRLGPPRRFTLEGRNNLPSAWTHDGQALFFDSDRNGNWDIFRQRLLERNAADFVWVPENKPDPGSVRTLPGSFTGVTPPKALEPRLQCVCCGCRSRSALQSRCSKPVAERQFDVHLDTCRVS